MDRFPFTTRKKFPLLFELEQGASSPMPASKLAQRKAIEQSNCSRSPLAEIGEFQVSGRRSGIRWTLVMLSGLALLSGCRRAAFNEYYVENMAGEIRALEDRIYEYDSAYTALELENEDLRRAIDELRSRNLSQPSGRSSSSLMLDLAPKTKDSLKGDASQLELGPVQVEELDLSPKSTKPRKIPAPSPTDKAKKTGTQSLLLEEVSPEPIDVPLEMPPVGIPNQNKRDGNSSSNSETSAPPLLDSQNSSEDVLPAPTSRQSTQPPFPPLEDGKTKGIKVPSDQELDLDFEMPTGLRKPGGRPLGQNNASPQRHVHLPELTQSSILQGKVKLPSDSMVVPASVQVPVNSQAPAANQVADTKLVEIGFHPTLARGHNFDDKPGDDGLYLVITPRNSRGEVLNVLGELTIVIEETNGDLSRRIAAWEVTPKELQESLEPIGASQGFHLSLPWDDVVPEGNLVNVFLKYRLPDGRTLVNRKDISLRKPGSRQTSWTPR